MRKTTRYTHAIFTVQYIHLVDALAQVVVVVVVVVVVAVLLDNDNDDDDDECCLPTISNEQSVTQSFTLSYSAIDCSDTGDDAANGVLVPLLSNGTVLLLLFGVVGNTTFLCRERM